MTTAARGAGAPRILSASGPQAPHRRARAQILAKARPSRSPGPLRIPRSCPVLRRDIGSPRIRGSARSRTIRPLGRVRRTLLLLDEARKPHHA